MVTNQGSWNDAQIAWHELRDALAAERRATQADPSLYVRTRRRATDAALDHLAFAITSLFEGDE